MSSFFVFFSLPFCHFYKFAPITIVEECMNENEITRWQDITITNNFMFSKILGDKNLWHKLFYNFGAYEKELNKTRRSVLQYFAEGKPQSPLTIKMDKRLSDAKVNTKWRAEYMTLEMELIGREKVGLEKGIKIGSQEGARKNAEETAKRMLAENMPLPKIAQFTGLSIDEIETLP